MATDHQTEANARREARTGAVMAQYESLVKAVRKHHGRDPGRRSRTRSVEPCSSSPARS